MTSSSWQKSARTAYLIMLWTFTIFVVAECCWGATAPLIGKMPPDQDTEVGSSISLNCTLLSEEITLGENVYRVNSSMIAFKFRSQYLPSDNVDILDPYTATLRLRNATADQSGLYYCFVQVPGVRNVTVCVSSVNIGYPPQKVQSFGCTSSNLENLTCFWTPQPNEVVPTYTLYDIIGYEDAYRGYVRSCPARLSANSCQWRSDTTPPIRQSAKVLNLRLIGNNSLGTYVQNFRIDHYKIVLPNKPENFNHKDVGTTYVVLAWSPPKHMEVFPPGLLYQIEYDVQSKKEEGLKVINVTKNMLEYNLTNLVPFTSYGFKIRCISSVAVDNEEMWSLFTYTVAMTLPDKPYVAPEVSPQGFEVQNFEGNRSIKIYWKFIPPKLYNGDNFQYSVSFYPTFVERPKRESRTMLLHVNSFFSHDNFDSNTAYHFVIRSVNNLGTSTNFSSLTVDKTENMPSTPTDITAVSLPHGVYKISWKAPNDSPFPIVNYTVFWCQNVKPRPYPCEGALDWTYVVGGHTNVSLTLPNNSVNYQFAVAANTDYSSSGMDWASCLVPYDGVLGKIEQVNIETVNATSLKIIWKLECSAQKAVVSEYQIFACEDTNVTCHSNACSLTGQQAVYRVSDPQASSFIIGGLRPHTYYGIKIRALTAKGRNEDSDLMCQMTLSGAPSDAPHNVAITDVSNSSATVSWAPPNQPNGDITAYHVFYNDQSTEVNSTVRTATIRHLRSYTNYVFQVMACVGNDCSNKSDPVSARTDIGVPGFMDSPIPEYVNSSFARISWKPPWNPNGPIDSYFINIYGENETLVHTLNVSGDHNCTYFTPDCEMLKDGKYNVLRIQAVNVVGNQTLVGPLSKPIQARFCIDPGKTPALTMILGVVIGGTLGLAALVFVLYFLVRWMKQKIDLMKDVKVKLPKGLDSPYSNPLNSYENFMSGLIRRSSTNLSPKLEPSAPPPPQPPDFTEDDEGFKNRHGSGNSQFSASSTDELLQKKGSRNYKLGRNPSGESSGCSSGGHDSISSSGTHHTNVSSDSGTEVDMACTNFSEPGCNAEEMLKKKPDHEYGKSGEPLDASLQKGRPAPSKCYVTPYSLFGTDKMPLPHCRALSLYGHNLANSEPSVADLGTEEEPYSSTKFTDEGWRLYSKFGLSNSTADVRDPYETSGGGEREKGLTPYSRFGICRPPADKLPYVTVGMALMLSDKDSESAALRNKKLQMQTAKKGDPPEKKRDGYVPVNQALQPSGGCYSMFGIQERDEPGAESQLPVPSSSKGYVSLHDVQIKLNNPAQSEDLEDDDTYDDQELLDALSVPEFMDTFVPEEKVKPPVSKAVAPAKNGYIAHDFVSKLPPSRDALPDVVCCTGTEWRTDLEPEEVQTKGGDALKSNPGKAEHVVKELGLVCNEV